MKHLLLFVALFAVSARAAERPNVLFIAVDDLNDWVGCLNPIARTPHIDKLAARGTLFTNAHCQSPLCNPSRASLLTGLRPSTTGIYTLVPGIRAVDTTKSAVTLPQYFRAAGYHTFATGKIFHDGSLPPKERAAEFEFYGDPGKNVFPPQKLVDTPDKMKAVDWGVFPERDEQTADWHIADSAITALNAAPRDKPFFIAAGFRLPHVPCFATQKWFDLYPDNDSILPPVKDNDRDDVPPFAWYLHWKLPEPRLSWLKKTNQWRNLTRSYLASTSFMDSQVGRVLDALQATGRADNTIVVLWSDHGWHIGEKAITGKNSLWDRSTRVPYIYAGPGVAKGARCDEPVELMDTYPTLIALAGLPEKTSLEGHSLLPQLKDAKTPRPWPAITTHNQGNHTVRSRDWRYIRYADGSEELYDRRADAHEWINLAKDPKYTDVKTEHAKWLPKENLPPAPGSAHRLLVQKDGTWYWEGKPIDPAQLED